MLDEPLDKQRQASPNFKPTAIALALSLAMAAKVQGATIEVTSPSDDGAGCTLREAIVSINNEVLEAGCSIASGAFGTDDSIIFDSSVAGQTLDLNSRVDISKSVEINPGGIMTTIELDTAQFAGGNSEAEVSFNNLTVAQGLSDVTAFQFSRGSLSLNNCMLRGNPLYVGTAIFAPDTDVTLNNSEISDFSRSAMFINNGTVNIIDSKLTGNGAGGFSGVGVSLTVLNSEITHNTSASSPGAPGIRARGTIEITDTVVAYNTATAALNGHAGGLSLAGTVTLRNVTVEHNSVGGRGGGMRLYGDGVINIYDSTIRYNSAGILGGGVDTPRDGNITFHRSTIVNNTATFFGGGITVGDFGAPTVSAVALHETTVSGNSANQGGGALVQYGASLELIQSTISGNSSTVGAGGGVFTRSSGEISMANSTVSGNYAKTMGGGFYNDTAVIDLINSTVASNTATTSGGGMYNTGVNSIDLLNTVISNSSGGDCAGQMISTDSFSWIEDASCNGIASGNPRLADLSGNGGLTQTHALLSGSPLRDAGDNAVCAAAPVNNLDQRGEVRPVGSMCDIGAVEALSDGSFFVIPLQNGSTVIFSL